MTLREEESYELENKSCQWRVKLWLALWQLEEVEGEVEEDKTFEVVIFVIFLSRSSCL